MIKYHFYTTANNSMNFLVVENHDTETWEAAILDWDLSDEEIEQAIKDFLAGEKEPYTDEYGVTWAEDKEHLLPECAKYFGFCVVDVD